MANEEQLVILKQGVDVWNKWRKENPVVEVDLSKADFSEQDLRNVNLHNARLQGVNFCNTNLDNADLSESYLKETTFQVAKLNNANLRKAIIDSTWFESVDLSGANLEEAICRVSYFSKPVYFFDAKLVEANLSKAQLEMADFSIANLTRANLDHADLVGCDFGQANLIGATLRNSQLNNVNFSGANLNEAILTGANLSKTNLSNADLKGADLRNVNLDGANLLFANVDKVNISGSRVHGINVWDLRGNFVAQSDLVITPKDSPAITVDNIKIAQFIYSILNNEEIRHVIDVLTSKSVLILGRFSLPERKTIIESLRSKLREYNLLPIVFDFDRPIDRDFTETIKTLAGLSYFVIADITNPKSSPLELQATVPDYQIPFVPIIQEGEYPFAMMTNLQSKYNWVLDTVSYDSLESLLKILKPGIIDPAIEKHNELRLIKAKEPKIRSAKDF